MQPVGWVEPLRNPSTPRAEKRWVSLTLYPSYELRTGLLRFAPHPSPAIAWGGRPSRSDGRVGAPLLSRSQTSTTATAKQPPPWPPLRVGRPSPQGGGRRKSVLPHRLR